MKENLDQAPCKILWVVQIGQRSDQQKLQGELDTSIGSFTMVEFVPKARSRNAERVGGSVFASGREAVQGLRKWKLDVLSFGLSNEIR